MLGQYRTDTSTARAIQRGAMDVCHRCDLSLCRRAEPDCTIHAVAGCLIALLFAPKRNLNQFATVACLVAGKDTGIF
ncbi:hypothetical protein OIDMADRAFT_148856 [Oidiodendron maius Zn]|uniref:Uncharacterized protein n=1 Tax=Oidiodendron maius (strain Zn) TaxID=913774 RepID=A0A0C3CZX6_OIDMZ|nr:hypothetical protein OIDMADRAFT_148856 [Oidiodendron maius Zn]